jgi:hypothetical protein
MVRFFWPSLADGGDSNIKRAIGQLVNYRIHHKFTLCSFATLDVSFSRTGD